MILGKDGMEKSYPIFNNRSCQYAYSPYNSYNIIINKGWNNDQISCYFHDRRMIIARTASGVPGWTAPDNRISFSKAGFVQTPSGNWPKFNGTFRIYYLPLEVTLSP